MNDKYRNAVMEDANEAAVSTLDNVMERVHSATPEARALWWEVFFSCVYAGMVVTLDGNQARAIALLDNLRKNASTNTDFIATELRGRL